MRSRLAGGQVALLVVNRHFAQEVNNDAFGLLLWLGLNSNGERLMYAHQCIIVLTVAAVRSRFHALFNLFEGPIIDRLCEQIPIIGEQAWVEIAVSQNEDGRAGIR